MSSRLLSLDSPDPQSSITLTYLEIKRWKKVIFKWKSCFTYFLDCSKPAHEGCDEAGTEHVREVDTWRGAGQEAGEGRSHLCLDPVGGHHQGLGILGAVEGRQQISKNEN